MLYVIDTNSISVLKNYYPRHFKSFWNKFNALVGDSRLISVREALKELDGIGDVQHLIDWVDSNRKIFLPPEAEETEFIKEIFSVSHFKYLIPEKKILTSNPLADPFVVASAKIRNGCVITEERPKANGAKIPNVCDYFGIKWTNLEGMMKTEKWDF